MSQKQIKTKERVVEHGEVFTNEREVNAMLDLVKNETERIDSRFLEPACGSGNFLLEILHLKLNIVEQKYKSSQIEFERYALIAIASIYGVDILKDNCTECRMRLYSYFNDKYSNLYKTNCKEEYKRSIRFILKRNIIWGDALDYTNPETGKPIVFSEWSALNSNMIKRRDYMFEFLVEKKHQYSLFDEDGEAASIDKPIKDYSAMHYLKLGENDSD